ncbi:hypothetical protein OsI_38969 [Oryza sativa Indica Group]|uniref:Uncharacterized protein n=4 Tax=Oryza TaxID=4527 RepID=A0A8J8XUZ9_ORYSJ|nr:hypothetical protein LOC_Os12g40400 [Oryza sativa Japonica Group]EAY83752.1 hypothetical protein OsI_38969 [Oryza sativa Indica Group]EAZ21092.1 hypothetical protein OsJ_36734 [Oryza sativa Japonica Group]
MAIFIVNFIPDTFSSVILCAKKKTGWKCRRGWSRGGEGVDTTRSPPLGMVKGDGDGEAKSESGSVVPPHKSNSFSSVATTTEWWVRLVAKGRDVAGSTSLVELKPSELACRCDSDGPPKLLGIYMAARRGGSEDDVYLPPLLSSLGHPQCETLLECPH